MAFQMTVCLLVVTGLMMTVTAHCPDYWVSFRGKCYRYFSNKPVPWEIAEHMCSSVAISAELGHLVSIHDDAEDQFVASLTAKSDNRKKRGPPAWIGLRYNHEERQFLWSDGLEYGYRGWRGSAPPHKDSQYCTVINSPWRADWNDQPCGKSYGFVCKMPNLAV